MDIRTYFMPLQTYFLSWFSPIRLPTSWFSTLWLPTIIFFIFYFSGIWLPTQLVFTYASVSKLVFTCITTNRVGFHPYSWSHLWYLFYFIFSFWFFFISLSLKRRFICILSDVTLLLVPFYKPWLCIDLSIGSKFICGIVDTWKLTKIFQSKSNMISKHLWSIPSYAPNMLFGL